MSTLLNDLLGLARQEKAEKAAAARRAEAERAARRRAEQEEALLGLAAPLGDLLGLRVAADAIIWDNWYPTLEGHVTVGEGVHLHTVVRQDGNARVQLDFRLPHLATVESLWLRWGEVDWEGKVVERLLGLLVEDAAAAEKQMERAAGWGRRLALAGQLVAAAQGYMESAHRPWAEACRGYAERWTAALWRPWSATTVRYVPVGCPPMSESDEGCDYIQSVVVENLPGGTPIWLNHLHSRIAAYNGDRSWITIGAFLDAEAVDFDEPCVTASLPYHLTLPVGAGFFINIPSGEERRPDDAPPTLPLSWRGYVRQSLAVGEELVGYWQGKSGSLQPDEIQGMSAEELLDASGYLIPDPSIL